MPTHTSLERRLVTLACTLSGLIGGAFTFICASSMGLAGFDEYYDLAHALAQGRSYQTLDRVWGYPYFLATLHGATRAHRRATRRAD